jgi:predicted nuclease of predicted toxin-antitoxin system
VRLYANENFPLPVVESLRRMGHDVLTTQEAGEAGRAVPDEEVLAFATREGRVLLTLNRKHFVFLHRERPEPAGIVVCTFDADFERQAAQVHRILENHPTLEGRLLRVNRPSSESRPKRSGGGPARP